MSETSQFRNVVVRMPSGDPESDEALLAEIRDYLARAEAVNCIQLANFLARETIDPAIAVHVAYAGSDVVGIMTKQPSFHPLLSHVEHGESVPALATAALEHGVDLPGVMGPSEVALAFARVWCERGTARFEPQMRQRILATSSVAPPTDVDGTWRLANRSDDDILRTWFAAFNVEALGMSEAEAADSVREMRARSDAGTGDVIWTDRRGIPVSVARYKAPTRTSIRIGPVYTPPEHRRKGFASAVTAATTQMLLERGHAFVCLYTKAENKTANHVYEAIGYRHVADSMIYRFVPDEPRKADD